MTRITTGPRILVLLAAVLLWVGAAALLSTETAAYPRYNDESAGVSCNTCHGEFTDATSPIGTTFPNGNKHTMHRSNQNMNTDCNLCHTSSDGNNPFIGSSDGTAANTGYGCVGCHGRVEDAGNDSISPGLGAGLRQHHENAGETSCSVCHSDALPANYTPVGESVTPAYYGTVDTNADEPCNLVATAGLNENWSVGDFLGLDNDGNGVYDGNDPDCAPSSPGETSDPTNQLVVTARDATTISVTYDPAACDAADHLFVFGDLNTVGSYTYTGADCSIGTSGNYNWSYGGGNLFFLVVANDGNLIEGSYGIGDGSERPAESSCVYTQDLMNRCD